MYYESPEEEMYIYRVKWEKEDLITQRVLNILHNPDYYCIFKEKSERI